MSQANGSGNEESKPQDQPILTESECILMEAQDEVLSTVESFCQTHQLDDLLKLMRANALYAEARRKTVIGQLLG